MSIPTSLEKVTPNRLQKTIGKFLTSDIGDIVASTRLGQLLIVGATIVLVRSQTGDSNHHPRFARSGFFRRMRRQDEDTQIEQLETLQQLIFDIQAGIESEEQILERIVKGVVDDMQYLGAFVATYEEEDDSLPMRTYHLEPEVASKEQVHLWEILSSQISGIRLSLSDPTIARVQVHETGFETNLSVRAYQKKRPVRDRELISLFRPIVPDNRPAIRSVIKGIQKGLGIKEVIAVPFFRPTAEGDTIKYDFLGNLFAVTTAPSFNDQEVKLLQAFGQQAAAGLKNARLYRQLEEQRQFAEEQRKLAEEQRRFAEEQRKLAEERQVKAEEQRQLAEARRKTAEIFAKMAFNSATNVHDLANQIGLIQIQFNNILRLLRQSGDSSAEQLEDLERRRRGIEGLFKTVTDILKNLHEPWSVPPDAATDINICLSNAIRKLGLEDEPEIHLSLKGVPKIHTSPAMLSEAFRVLIKNAVEAMEATKNEDDDRGLWVRSRVKGSSIEIIIRDTGVGIEPENLSKIFEMGWSTKEHGLGFGLFWVKDFIEEGLKGNLKVESMLQQGTTFNISIPYISENQDNLAIFDQLTEVL